ncbi:MAG: 4Fe-4S dicluster domain-containing protein [Deltaproteobacteria bacterium]|nr:4Fe-4S dicluster domain-containing protein [Deltaproteobacteria bacterium]
MGISRRKFLGWMGAAAGAAAASMKPKAAAAAAAKSFPGHPDSLGVLHDTTRCIGCRKCEAACNEVNNLPKPEAPFDDLSVLERRRRTHAGSYTVVNKFSVPGKKDPVFVKRQCNHCLEPACASACFVQAFKKSEKGPVVYNEKVCVGCRYCMVACPFYVPAYEYDKALTPRVTKCTMCAPRIAEGKLPGCVAACPKEALTFGPRKKLLEYARARIAKHPDRYVGHIYGEREMGGTSWLYLSGVDFGHIGMDTGIGDLPAAAYTAGPLAAVPLVVGLWPVLLTGIWAISKRKEKRASDELSAALAANTAAHEQKKREELSALRQKLSKEKEAAVERAVKQALEEAEKEREQAAAEAGKEGGRQHEPAARQGGAEKGEAEQADKEN